MPLQNHDSDRYVPRSRSENVDIVYKASASTASATCDKDPSPLVYHNGPVYMLPRGMILSKLKCLDFCSNM